ncbi:MAG: membrane protein insertion efficiency factor YidD [Endomicrobium sp.]|jgi:putative membrane protein insertion efficiency factor|nr:membrane protein insertion efficiency factor YidD [Endomicrobium sp.]
MKYIVLNFIKCYRFFSKHIFTNRCRFQPTCSLYACKVIRLYGCFLGVFLILIRILRCNRLHPGGYDPVPIRFTFKDILRK